MSKRVLRTSLYILAAIGIALAVLVAVLLVTPFGARRVASYGWSKAVGASGATLSMDATRGSIARGVVFEGVVLADADGTSFFSADELGLELGSLGPRSKRVELREVRLDGAEFLFSPDADGGTLGWNAFRRDSADRASADSSDARPWVVTFDLTLARSTVLVSRPASELEIAVGPFEGTASGTLKEIEATLAGLASFEKPPLRGPVTGEFEGSVRYDAAGVVELAPLRLATSVGEALVSGLVRFRLVELLGASGLRGQDTIIDFLSQDRYDMVRVMAQAFRQERSGR